MNFASHRKNTMLFSRRTFSRKAVTPRLGLQARLVALTLLVMGAGACSNAENISATDRREIADSLQHLVAAAYDFSQPNPVQRLLSLYPDSGRVISASSGHISATKTALATEIAGFWQRVGQNMKAPSFVLGSAYVDVITKNAAIMTFTYSIPHKTPRDMPHTVSGAWTTFWRKQGGRWVIVQEHLSDTPESAGAPSMLPDTVPPPMPGQNMPGHLMPGGSKN